MHSYLATNELLSKVNIQLFEFLICAYNDLFVENPNAPREKGQSFPPKAICEIFIWWKLTFGGPMTQKKNEMTENFWWDKNCDLFYNCW